MVWLTVVDKILALWFASTSEKVPMVKKARTEYEGGCALDGDETKLFYLFTVDFTIWKSIPDKKSRQNVLPLIDCHILWLTFYLRLKIRPLIEYHKFFLQCTFSLQSTKLYVMHS